MNDSVKFNIEFKSIAHLKQCMKIYDTMIVQLTHFIVKKKLVKSIFIYKNRLFFLFEQHTFESVIEYHKMFIYIRICEDQNDVQTWRIIDHTLEASYLSKKLRKLRKSYSTYHISAYSISAYFTSTYSADHIIYSTNYADIFIEHCKRFNFDDHCTFFLYKYKYLCGTCQSSNHDIKDCK